METKREATAQAVKEAAKAWSRAPVHVRTMAGAYVNPLMAAIEAMESEKAEAHEKGRELAGLLLELTSRSGKEIRIYADEFAAFFGMERT